MEEDFKRLMQKLAGLDRKTQEIDQALKDVRIGIHNLFWDLINLKKSKAGINRENQTEIAVTTTPTAGPTPTP